MSDAAVPEFRGPLVDDDEILLRLVWDSDDIDSQTRELSTSAFSKNDLLGPECGLSVDRENLAIKDVILHLVNKQRDKAVGNIQLNRTAPLLSKVKSGAIMELKFSDEDLKMFVVIATPIPESTDGPENPAHAEIINISERNKKSDINQLRTKLQPLFSTPSPFDEILKS